MNRRTHPNGFTIVEMLFAAAVVAVLAALAFPALASAQGRSQAAGCSGRMRDIGMAFLLYSQENQGRLPRSSHSAGANREPGWAASIAPYLGARPADANAAWVNRKFACPCSNERTDGAYSYGLNVFFELGPGDSYVGRPSTWRCLPQIPAPARTILLAESRPTSGGMGADHFMCHQWSAVNAAKNAVAHDRHSGRANYLFTDGHVESLPVERTFTSRDANSWNPSTACRP